MWAQVIESLRKCFIPQAQRATQAAVFPSSDPRSVFVKPNTVSVTRDEFVKTVLEPLEYDSFLSARKLQEGPHHSGLRCRTLPQVCPHQPRGHRETTGTRGVSRGDTVLFQRSFRDEGGGPDCLRHTVRWRLARVWPSGLQVGIRILAVTSFRGEATGGALCCWPSSLRRREGKGLYWSRRL